MDINVLKTIQVDFLQELQRAYRKEKSSLPFIVHKLPSVSLVKDGELFEVLVIGGSVCKKALLKKQNKGFEITHKESKNQIQFKKKEDLFRFLEQELDPTIQIVALNFAYPLQPVFENGRLDGILLSGSKENTFEGLIGKKIGFEIEQYIHKKQNRSINVSVANDTVCLLLSGLTQYSPSNLACGIVGTGLNFAFFLDKNHLVNLESANFDKFLQSKEGREIDLESAHKGKALFEKETAGAYLYKHFNSILQKDHIDFSPINSTWELKKLALQNIPHVSDIARKLINYSAALVACQIGGIVLFKKRDLIFVMDGSFFWDENIYKDKVGQYVRQLVPEYKIMFVKIEDSSISGAAELVV